MAEMPAIRVPAIYPALSTSKVLTMEFMDGVKVTNGEAIDGAGLDRARLARDYIAAAIKQLLFDGFFHGDPHPGNVLINLGTGQVVFIDMGMVGQLTRDQRMNLADLILALREGDPKDLGRVLMALSIRFKPVDESAFLRDLERLYHRYTMFADEGAGEGFSDIIGGALGLMHEHGLRLDPQLTLAIKALTQSEQNSRTLDPNMHIVDVSFDASKEILVQQLDADVIMDMVRRELMRSGKDLVRRLPTLSEATLKWLDQYESGRLTLYIDTEKLSGNLTSFGWSVKQLAIAILLVGMIIGTALAADTDMMNAFRFLPSIVTLLFLFAMIMGFLWVIGLVREYWRRET
jgi:ubiquinone biosynthesis protein